MTEVLVRGTIKGTYEIKGEKAALLCPPHPLMGGNRFDVRLERMANELHKIGFSTLRFDYQKPFRSGIGEIEDAKMCLEYLKENHPFVAIIGYSFGSIVASNIAGECDALVLISPIKKIDDIELKDSKVPKLMVFATKDDIISAEDSMEIFDFLSHPKEVLKLETDHFYFGKFDVLARSVADFLKRITKG